MVTLLAGGQAEAAPGVDWDRIAQCESGRNWAASTGNGYYGGLQFTASTWASNGGAGNPAHASREEQIRVAENVLRTQGIGAWGACGRRGHTGAPPPRRSASSSASRLSGPAAQPRTPPAPVSGSASNPGGEYTIKPGETLASIARELGIEGGWQALVARNQPFLTNPDLIYPGHKITTGQASRGNPAAGERGSVRGRMFW
ncbi:transglycosylase [Lentzea flava]|uniref:Transglycosylase n=1 Tax=Lentzea flava TaxID=103732 RepID=A0ABQ2VHB8_9PSEU|nr:LysM domain-containing protein [Lentzea flava]GGU84454.1 transglycosylase [Lentzea flava]